MDKMLILLILGSLLLSPPVDDPGTGLGKEVFHTDILEAINTLRREGCRCGRKRMKPAPPLRWNERLEAAAKRHAKDMAANKFFDHTGSDGSSFVQRIEEAGYDWQFVGENIGFGYREAGAALEGWLESPHHCRNIMNPDYREMGIAHEGTYWVQTLATGWEE